jgi:hypothetical protein
VYKILVGSLRGREYSEDPDIDEKVVLTWILGK